MVKIIETCFISCQLLGLFANTISVYKQRMQVVMCFADLLSTMVQKLGRSGSETGPQVNLLHYFA